jgi:alpha-glucosidase (family GH31 glycosyl hydrolase)
LITLLGPILILSRTKKRNELLGRRRNELLFHLGPQMQDVVTTYTDLTGKPELPPLWAWLPSMQVELLSESNFKAIAAKFTQNSM